LRHVVKFFCALFVLNEEEEDKKKSEFFLVKITSKL